MTYAPTTISILRSFFILGVFLLTHPLSLPVCATDINGERDEEMQIARNNIQCVFQGINISGLRILDIGGAKGHNAAAMSEKGAIVDVLEPNKEYLLAAIKNNRVPEERAHYGRIEDFEEETREELIAHGIDPSGWEKGVEEFRSIPELAREFDGQFDIVTIFMTVIDEGGAAKRLADLLKPNGKLIIGYGSDGEYINGHEKPRRKLEPYFKPPSVLRPEWGTSVLEETMAEDGTLHIRCVYNGPRYSNAVFVTFEKR
jgi:SAM-dependent methyltransferase